MIDKRIWKSSKIFMQAFANTFKKLSFTSKLIIRIIKICIYYMILYSFIYL